MWSANPVPLTGRGVGLTNLESVESLSVEWLHDIDHDRALAAWTELTLGAAHDEGGT